MPACELFGFAFVTFCEQGTFLYVGVYDDATVAHYKGRHHPVMSVHERVLNVLQCVHVDEVVIGAPFDVTPDLIKTLNVAVVARCKSEHTHASTLRCVRSRTRARWTAVSKR